MSESPAPNVSFSLGNNRGFGSEQQMEDLERQFASDTPNPSHSPEIAMAAAMVDASQIPPDVTKFCDYHVTRARRTATDMGDEAEKMRAAADVLDAGAARIIALAEAARADFIASVQAELRGRAAIPTAIAARDRATNGRVQS